MLKRVTGNLIDMAEEGLFDVIVHGCNCLNTMGSGIALEIRTRYPGAYEADTLMDRTVGESHRYMKLGNYSEITITSNISTFVILNCYTQYNFYPRGVDHFEYTAFKLILQKISHFYGNKKIGIPFIGMGLGGGNRELIVSMIQDFANAVTSKGGEVTLVEFRQ